MEPGSAFALMALGLALGCGACSDHPRHGVLIPVAESAEGTSRVPLLIATTREQLVSDPGEMFSGGRAANMSFAAVTVSIPPDSARKVGSIQWPASPPGDPRRDFVTVSAGYLEKQSFNAAISAATKPSRKVVVFVHGFNNRFDEAVYRFAQIMHDLRRSKSRYFSHGPRRASWRCAPIPTTGKVRTICAMPWKSCWTC